MINSACVSFVFVGTPARDYTLVVKALFAQIVKQLLRTVGLDH